MQDYNYLEAGVFETTLEVSCCKYPNETYLQHFWLDNKDALINYILEVHRGNEMMKKKIFYHFNPFPCTPYWDCPIFREAADDNWNVAIKVF